MKDVPTSGSLTDRFLMMKFVTNSRAEIPTFKQKYSNMEDLSLKWDLIKMEVRVLQLNILKTKQRIENLQKFTFKIKSTNFAKELKNIPTTSKLLAKSIMPDLA